MEFVLAIVILCGIGIKELCGEIGWRNFQEERAAEARAAREALDRPRREFDDRYTNDDYAEMLEMVIQNRIPENAPGYDPEVSEYFCKELRSAVCGTKYWQKLADPLENPGYAAQILLAAHGYVDRNRPHPLESVGKILAFHMAVGHPSDTQEYPTEAYIELLELIEELLHERGVPYGWELFRDIYGNAALTWGGFILDERFRGKRGRLSLPEVKQEIREAEDKRKQFLDMRARTGKYCPY